MPLLLASKSTPRPGVGRGADDDDIGTQTPRAISPRYLQYFRDGGPSYMMMVDDGGDDDDA